MMFSTFKRHFACILLFILFGLRAMAAAPMAVVNIPFGQSGNIAYNLKTGTFNVSQYGRQVFSNIFAAAAFNADTLTSKGYTTRKYNKLFVKDGFGKGFKHIIVLTAKGLPQMKQVFYTYNGCDYFFAQATFTGTKLKTNYLSPLIGQFAPVTGGDLRSLFVPFDNDTFISYNSKPFTGSTYSVSSEVGTVFSNTTRAGIVAGSLEHEVWKTGVAMQSPTNQLKVWAGYTDAAVTRDTIAHGYISGNSVASPRMFVGYFKDWRKGMEAYAKANRIAEPPFIFKWTKPTPVGWNSWGVIQEHIDYDKTIKTVNFFADSIPAFRTGNTAYIDLDSYWDKLISNGDYSKLKAVADYCKAKGLQPGVYWAPFTDWGHAGGPNRTADGGSYKFGDMWTKTGKAYHNIDGARALDPTHPGTLRRIDYIIGRLKDCGFTMIKIDFLGHAAVESEHFYDPKITTGMQAYKAGMEYLIKKLDGQMLVYAAISPSMATGRYTHMRRIACDAFKSIDHTQYTLNSVTYGWWQTYLYDFIDADHVVFNDEKIGANRARLLSALVTGTWISGDDFTKVGPWTARAKKYFQDPELLQLVKNGKAFLPAEGNTGTGASEVFTRQIGKDVYLAVFNYGRNKKEFVLDAARVGIDPAAVASVKEILQGNTINIKKDIGFSLEGADAVLYKISLK